MKGRDPMNLTCRFTSACSWETNRSLCSSLLLLTFNPGVQIRSLANLLIEELSPHGSIVEPHRYLNRRVQAKSSIRGFILRIDH